MACLCTSDAGSLTASELVQRLQVSPASISRAIAFLESQGLVRRERDERRRERYALDDDVRYQAMMASVRSTAQVAETARQGVGILVPGTPAPRHPGRRPAGEHRPLPRLRLRKSRPRRRPGPRRPPHETRNNLKRHRPTKSRPA
ncbi:hypothetical protein GCM10018980_71700 [Streptomyces capoamus]|uniref:HTH marR-type domain-containing protein n=1 Tax=Streptomyces capoamus TaxID=68183 RepID=A0A919KG20_9ACTN|nr:hypothetical protein GCM10010501_16340 [Streptomyces libani subsp. rufus]GHG74697.1 hypothetical protein GCM10018980_71700 [Streptomyces capoamus]